MKNNFVNLTLKFIVKMLQNDQHGDSGAMEHWWRQRYVHLRPVTRHVQQDVPARWPSERIFTVCPFAQFAQSKPRLHLICIFKLTCEPFSAGPGTFDDWNRRCACGSGDYNCAICRGQKRRTGDQERRFDAQETDGQDVPQHQRHVHHQVQWQVVQEQSERHGRRCWRFDRSQSSEAGGDCAQSQRTVRRFHSFHQSEDPQSTGQSEPSMGQLRTFSQIGDHQFDTQRRRHECTGQVDSEQHSGDAQQPLLPAPSKAFRHVPHGLERMPIQRQR